MTHNPSSVTDAQIETATLTDLPWWKSSEGNLLVLPYLIFVHLAAVVGLIMFPLPGWGVFFSTLALAYLGSWGTTVCFHRCLSHRALKLNAWVEQILIFFAMINVSSTPVNYAANHRNHHAEADRPGDLSSPRYGGFWWAHVRWLYQRPNSNPKRWCPDLLKPKYMAWSRLQIPMVALGTFIGAAFGWKALFWLGPIRIVYCLHGQWFVNSLLHLTPGLPEGEDSSRNLGWLGPFQLGAWGENWHRNHHFNPTSARFSQNRGQIDLGWELIRVLKYSGLAWDLKTPAKKPVQTRAKPADLSIPPREISLPALSTPIESGRLTTT